MALKSGISHAFSTLVLTLIAAILIQFLKHKFFFEILFDLNYQLAHRLSEAIRMLFYVSFPVFIIEYGLVAFVLSFLWGVGYHAIRNRDSG